MGFEQPFMNVSPAEQEKSSFRETSPSVWDRILRAAAKEILLNTDGIDKHASENLERNVDTLATAIEDKIANDSVLESKINRLSKDWETDIAHAPNVDIVESEKQKLLLNELKSKLNMTHLFSNSNSSLH